MKERIEKLRLALDATGLTRHTNFFSVHKNSLDVRILGWVIMEYSALSNIAIHLLLDSAIRVHDWTKLKDEVMENISEEMGLDTRKVPHLEMMRMGYMKELNIRTDDVVPSGITKTFIDHIVKVFKHNDNAFQAGALLALEGSAIEEFHIMDGIIRKYADKSELEFNDEWLTNLYIDGHKSFEIGHEAHLMEAILPYINADNFSKFEIGYNTVITLFSAWWQQLAIESSVFTMERMVSSINTEEPDLHKIFETK